MRHTFLQHYPVPGTCLLDEKDGERNWIWCMQRTNANRTQYCGRCCSRYIATGSSRNILGFFANSDATQPMMFSNRCKISAQKKIFAIVWRSLVAESQGRRRGWGKLSGQNTIILEDPLAYKQVLEVGNSLSNKNIRPTNGQNLNAGYYKLVDQGGAEAAVIIGYILFGNQWSICW